MGTKYSSQSATGYNSAPPSDDGTAVSSNEVKWSFIKTKIGDPVKDLADNINTALGTHFDESVVDKAVNFTTTAAEHKRTINATAAITVSLGDATTMAAGYIVTVKNSHTAAITVDLATGADTLDGTAAGSVSLSPDVAMTFATTSGADGYFLVGSGFVATLTDNSIPDQTDIGADIADTDEMLISDGGSIRRSDMSRVETYVHGEAFGGQLKFPATPSLSADPNTLDGYEEDISVTSMAPTTSGTITVNTSGDSLISVRVGRCVLVSGRLTVSSVSSPVGNINIPLPFANAALSDTADITTIPVFVSGAVTVSTGFSLRGRIQGTGSNLLIEQLTGGATAANEMQAGTSLEFNFWYPTDD